MNNMEDMENLQVVFPFMTMSNKPQNENSKINIARKLSYFNNSNMAIVHRLEKWQKQLNF